MRSIIKASLDLPLDCQRLIVAFENPVTQQLFQRIPVSERDSFVMRLKLPHKQYEYAVTREPPDKVITFDSFYEPVMIVSKGAHAISNVVCVGFLPQCNVLCRSLENEGATIECSADDKSLDFPSFNYSTCTYRMPKWRTIILSYAAQPDHIFRVDTHSRNSVQVREFQFTSTNN